MLLITGVHPMSDIVGRFFSSDRNLPQSQLRTIPSRVAERLQRHGLIWTQLSGISQRAVLWDMGFVLNSNNDILQVYTACGGEGMRDIDISTSTFRSVCTTRQCGIYQRSQICSGTHLAPICRCAVERGDALPSSSSIWAENNTTANQLPHPMVYKHESPGILGWIIYGIHFRTEVEVGQCPSEPEMIIPCVPYDTTDTKWCIPPDSTAMDNWLQSIITPAPIPTPVTPGPTTESPSTPVTPATPAPSPTTESPETPVPVTPVPTTEIPATSAPSPTTEIPSTPVPVTPATPVPSPTTGIPSTPVPVKPVPTTEIPATSAPSPTTEIPSTPVPVIQSPATSGPTPIPVTPGPESNIEKDKDDDAVVGPTQSSTSTSSTVFTITGVLLVVVCAVGYVIYKRRRDNNYHGLLDNLPNPENVVT